MRAAQSESRHWRNGDPGLKSNSTTAHLLPNRIAAEIKQHGVRITTSDAVVLEIGAARYM
ncbi:MAG: hypothetical protein Q8M11_09550 [Sulfuritalea sp.]|nr:hypothetical protein [Sulfuritalea sp.]